MDDALNISAYNKSDPITNVPITGGDCDKETLKGRTGRTACDTSATARVTEGLPRHVAGGHLPLIALEEAYTTRECVIRRTSSLKSGRHFLGAIELVC